MNRATFDFSGRRVLVTGGTSGIGHAVAVAFRDAGASVTVTGTRSSVDEYDTDLAGLDYRQLRMTDADAVTAVGNSMDLLDVLVNNAGANLPGGRDEWEPDVFDASVAINLSGAFRLSVACHDSLRRSKAEGGASIVNVVSLSAFLAVPIVPGYGSGKAGLMQLTRNLAVQWAADGIRVNAIAPGIIETPMTRPMMKHLPEVVATELARIPMGRFGTAGEVAPVVLFLASAAARYITGSVFPIDGGRMAV